MGQMLLHEQESRETLDMALAGFVAERLAEGVALRGEASLVVSGGNTPKGLFDLLSRVPLPWSRIKVTLTDERWLPPSHPDSNERSVRERLLQKVASAALFVPLYDGSGTASEGLAAALAALSGIPRPFDVVILGMGLDGHTASLFPGALPTGETPPCLAVAAPRLPNVPVERISLSATALTDCRHLLLHITGEDKRTLLRQAQIPGEVQELPIRIALRPENLPCHVFWAP